MGTRVVKALGRRVACLRGSWGTHMPMYVQMSIHRPKRGKGELVVDSMHRFQGAIRGRRGLRSVGSYKDRRTGALVGIAVWDDFESMAAARPAMAEATRDDRFDEWEEGETQAFQLDEV